MTRLTDHELYYLRSIQTNMEQLRELVRTRTELLGLSIGSEVLADNYNWLDCFIDAEQRVLADPRPIAEYHEDMGTVLWWCWKDGAWLGEPPYVGSPRDLGFTVEAHVRLISQMDQEHEPEIVRRTLGGWPGYHTHFTPLPPMPKEPSK